MLSFLWSDLTDVDSSSSFTFLCTSILDAPTDYLNMQCSSPHSLPWAIEKITDLAKSAKFPRRAENIGVDLHLFLVFPYFL